MRGAATLGGRSGALSLRALTPAARRVLLVLTLAAIACRAFIPAGWMPASDGHRITVALCSGLGAQTVTLTLPGKSDHPSDPHKTHPPCIFSGLSAPALGGGNAMPSFERLAVPPLLPVIAPYLLVVRIAGRFLPPSQGPPALPI